MLAKVTGTLFAGIDNNCKDFLTIIFLVKYFGVMLKREGKKKKNQQLATHQIFSLCAFQLLFI